MKVYYATSTVIRYYVEGVQPKWPDPPHVAFANLELGEASLKMFAQRYGPLYVPKGTSGEGHTLADLIARSGVPAAAPALARRFKPDRNRALALQKLLQAAWRGDRSVIVMMESDLNRKGLRPSFGITGKLGGLKEPSNALTLWADDIWTLLRVAFLMDYKQGRAKICANPDGPTPYFVENRKGQEFCEHKYAVLINVRRFREREEQARKRTTKKGRRKH